MNLNKEILAIVVLFIPTLCLHSLSSAAENAYQPIENKSHLIDIAKSFRYSTKKFLNPLLSPDDKWLVYQKLETSGKDLYYTRLGKHDENPVPLNPSGNKQKTAKVGENKRWSPDGKFLAFYAKVDYIERIILVDFSGEKPRFMESLRSYGQGSVPGDNFRWTRDGILIYLDEYANIMKKRPGKRKPERVVYFRSSHSVAGGADSFDVASNGVLIYRSGKTIYSTDSRNPDSRSIVFSGEDMSGMSIAPNGQHAMLIFASNAEGGKRERRTSIIELKSRETISVPQRISRAAWSPDGTKVAYVEETSPQKDKDDPSKTIWWNPHFFIIDLTTKDIKDYNYGVSKDFNWTPDGQHIIYSMKNAHPYLGFYENGIFIMRISDGSEIGQVTKINASSPPMISPSGKYIIWKGFNMDAFFVSSNPLPSEMFADKQ